MIQIPAKRYSSRPPLDFSLREYSFGTRSYPVAPHGKMV